MDSFFNIILSQSVFFIVLIVTKFFKAHYLLSWVRNEWNKILGYIQRQRLSCSNWIDIIPLDKVNICSQIFLSQFIEFPSCLFLVNLWEFPSIFTSVITAVYCRCIGVLVSMCKLQCHIIYWLLFKFSYFCFAYEKRLRILF